MEIMKTDELERACKKTGWSYDIFKTALPNNREDSVLFLYVGKKPNNRRHHRFIKSWDVTHSINGGVKLRRPKSIIKWNKAVTSAIKYVQKNPAPDPDELDLQKENQLLERYYNKRRKINQEKQAYRDKFNKEQASIEASEALTPIEAMNRGLIQLNPYYKNTDISDLVSIKSLRLWKGKLMVYEAQIDEPTQWRLFSNLPHQPLGCLKHPSNKGRSKNK